MSLRSAPGSIASIQRTLSGNNSKSSTMPMIGIASGIRSNGDTRYSSSNAAPGFSQLGAKGWRNANHNGRASPRTSTHYIVNRFHMCCCWR